MAEVGFVGLGRMGVPMASHLVEAGHAVRGYDVSPEARARVPGSVDTLAGAAREIVVLMLPDSSVVRQVLLDDGLLDALAPGSLVVDMSSSQPTETRALAEEAEARGLELVDAPVSGGVRGAVEGTLAIMFGGSDAQFERVRPLLEAMGEKVMHVGGVGAGHALKALNNLLSGTTLLASAEALLVGRRFGLDPQVMLDAINVSSGRSWSTEYKLPEFVLTERYDAGFAATLMAKDLSIAAGLAEATGSPFELGRVSTAIWERAAAELPADADHTAVARWLAEALA